MRKFVAITAAVCMFAGFTGQAFAGSVNHDLKISGEYELDYVYDDTSMVDEEDNEKSFIEHELDIKFKLGVGENLTIGGKMEYADSTLGEDDHALGKDNNIDVEKAYIQAKFSNVKMTAGKFSYALPSVFDGGPILDDEGTGIDFDFGVASVGMLRASDAREATEDKNDIFYVKGKVGSGNIELKPYVAYQLQGEKIEDDGKDYAYNAFWLGTALEMKAGPLKLLGDFVYGSKSWSDDTMGSDESGIFLDFAAEMDMGSMSPTAFLIYSTGNDDDGKEKETIPTISPDFEPLNIFGDANEDIDFLGGLVGVGIGVKDLSLVPKLKHDIILFYAMGTNDKANSDSFTDEDSAMEIDFNTAYKLMDDFKIYADLGYSVVDLDEDTHGKVEDEAGIYMEFGMEIDF